MRVVDESIAAEEVLLSTSDLEGILTGLARREVERFFSFAETHDDQLFWRALGFDWQREFCKRVVVWIEDPHVDQECAVALEFALDVSGDFGKVDAWGEAEQFLL